jgi:hypothetical protein
MARKGLRQQTHRGFHTGATAVPNASTPTSCPLCDETPDGMQGKNGHLVLQTHLMERHRLVDFCRHHHERSASQEWKLDWDAVLHKQARIWYGAECGFYAPTELG